MCCETRPPYRALIFLHDVIDVVFVETSSRDQNTSRVLKVTRVLKLQRARLGSRESKLKPLRRNETAVSRPASSSDLS